MLIQVIGTGLFSLIGHSRIACLFCRTRSRKKRQAVQKAYTITPFSSIRQVEQINDHAHCLEAQGIYNPLICFDSVQESLPFILLTSETFAIHGIIFFRHINSQGGN